MRSDYQVIRLAIETEIDGYRYFNSAAERAVHDRARDTWMSLAADEIEHMKILQAQLHGLGKPETDDDDTSEAKDKAVIAPTSTVPESVNRDDDLAALQIGLDVEARTRDFYAKAATETENAAMKAVYEQLAAMEDGHYRLIDETYRFLADPQGWNFDQVRPISDGA
jgi:rubrerythrin